MFPSSSSSSASSTGPANTAHNIVPRHRYNAASADSYIPSDPYAAYRVHPIIDLDAWRLEERRRQRLERNSWWKTMMSAIGACIGFEPREEEGPSAGENVAHLTDRYSYGRGRRRLGDHQDGFHGMPPMGTPFETLCPHISVQEFWRDVGNNSAMLVY